MGDGIPSTFEEAMVVIFGDRGAEFSPELKLMLRRLYERGRRDGRHERKKEHGEGYETTRHDLYQTAMWQERDREDLRAFLRESAKRTQDW